MLHNSRALRRASDAASARAAVNSRRSRWVLGSVTGGVIGLALTVGIVAAPAAGAELPDAVDHVTALVTGADPLHKTVDDSAITIKLAKDAIAAADAKSAEVAASGLDLAGAPAAVETQDLTAWIGQLADRDALSDRELTSLTAYTVTGTEAVVAETAALQSSYDAAQQAKAAAEQAAAEAAAAAEALAQANTVDGAKATARSMASSQYGWGDDQFSCLNSLWTKESGWNYQAYNSSGGATGIPQALPGSKMASAGSDWQTNAATQISWGLGYISSVYGTPCSAWGHSQATNWY
ncbi:phospholipase [Microbacterium sp. C5A9]|uniref:aggregation-promoting factor C-terminal-like domain-containing protein n=1 Tax=Microbacterium sp. C5A9 TaxID=2736663 RepID=UPI001F527E76|nr:phospholipase [Microbacterium sp. C5A9]MCI1020227.1 phospholipase [Microbacterium sp. C5A9]